MAAAEALQSLAAIASTFESAEAEKLFEAAVVIYQRQGDHRAQAVVLGELARLKALGGHTAEAVRLHQRALSIVERLGDLQAHDVALNEIARLQLESRGATSAGPLARLASVFVKRSATVEWRNTLSFLFGRIASAYTDPKKAVDLLEFLLDQSPPFADWWRSMWTNTIGYCRIRRFGDRRLTRCTSGQGTRSRQT